MKKYCKAYQLKDLRQFSNWTDAGIDAGMQLTDETVVYLWDDFTVVTSPTDSDKGRLWATISPEWKYFCYNTLHFEIPEDLRYAYS